MLQRSPARFVTCRRLQLVPMIYSAASAGKAKAALAAVGLVLVLAPLVLAQAPRRHLNSKTTAPTQFLGLDVGAVDRREPAGQSQNSPSAIVIKSEWQQERERVLALRQASRDAAKARREATWASLPVKYYSDEDRARSKYTIARQLWHNGRVDSSRRFLEQLIADYPLTETAERAKLVLTRF